MWLPSPLHVLKSSFPGDGYLVRPWGNVSPCGKVLIETARVTAYHVRKGRERECEVAGHTEAERKEC